jgi:phosphate transport system substrate-binding protein
VESVSAAAQGEIPADTRVMLTNSENPGAYPISAFTWIILYQEQAYNGRSLQQTQQTLKFLRWLIGPEGQAIAPKVDYAPLPQRAAELANNILRTVTYKGKAVIKE